MTSSRTLPYLLGLVAVLIAFVVLKFEALSLPLFWDEAWVYGPAIRSMNSSGASLLPDAIGTDLSRGHPLLFHFVATLWTKVFGISNFSLHSFALAIAVVTVIVTFWIGSSLGSSQIGIAAVLIVVLNESFFTQSAILLPEILLGLFWLLAVRYFMTRNAIGYLVFATAALYTKESGIVLVLALFCWQIALLLNDPTSLRDVKVKRWLALILLPIPMAALFFLYQYCRYGWFFYPDHLGMMTLGVNDLHYKVKFAYRLLFEEQGMEWVTFAFGLLATLAWRGWKHWYIGVLAALLYVSTIKVLDGKWSLPPLWTLLFCTGTFVAAFFLHPMSVYRKEPRTGQFPAIAMVLVLGFIAFSAMNFFTDRYLVGLVPFVALGIMAILHSALAPHHKLLFPAVALVLCGIVGLRIGTDEHIGDTRMAYVDAIRAQLTLIQHMEKAGSQDHAIHASFIDKVYLTDPDAGYLSGRPFTTVSDTLSESTDFIVVSASDRSLGKDTTALNGYVLVERIQVGQAWTELYARTAP